MSGPSHRLGVDRALVDGAWVDGDVRLDGSTVAEVGLPADGGGRRAVAGFVDLQVNGFAGVDFATTDAEGYRHAGEAMSASGVTGFQPTFISLPWAAYDQALRTAAEARASTPGMIGIHLEGPFLSPTRCGAHDPANLLAPEPARVEELLHPVVNWMTIAPELDGGLEAIATVVATGRHVAVGHSDADARTAEAAFDAGATVVTHLFNAQSPLLHRAPGVPGAALASDARVGVTVIVDGHHLAPEIVRMIFAAKPGRVALITDAIAAAAMGDGETVLGDRAVTVANGAARLADGTLAGSVLTMDQAVRNTVECGVDERSALLAATPGRTVAPGSAADLVVLDDDLEVVRTLRTGEEIHHR